MLGVASGFDIRQQSCRRRSATQLDNVQHIASIVCDCLGCGCFGGVVLAVLPEVVGVVELVNSIRARAVGSYQARGLWFP